MFLLALVCAACGSAGETALPPEPTAVAPATAPASPNPIAPTAVVAPTPVAVSQSEEPDEESPVPFPPPQNLQEYDQPDTLVLGTPPTIFDLYDDAIPVDDFVVYEENGPRSVSMTDAYRKEGRTYGYVTWTDADGTTQSTSSPASHELATCAAEQLARSMDRYEAEVVARGVISEDNADARKELIDLYIDCDGTEELLTSFRDDLALTGGLSPFDIACVDEAVTTEDHLRIVSNATDGFSNDEFLELVGPCFNWSVVGFPLAQSSLECLQPLKIDGLRSVIQGDFAGFTALLEPCLTPDELTQLPD